MLTQCPNCETTFRVTSEILRVAQGQVRCGRCQTQFDALQRLIEERPVPAANAGRLSRSEQLAAQQRVDDASQIEVEEPETHEDITMEGKRIEISGTYRVLDDESIDGASHLRQEVVEEWMEVDEVADGDDVVHQGYVDVSQEFDETGTFDATGTFDSTSTFDELEDSRERLMRDFSATNTSDAIDPEAVPRARRPGILDRGMRDDRADALLSGSPAINDDDPDDLASLTRRPRRQVSLIWKIAFAPLLLLLIAQIVHHNRAELARHPRLGAPLMSIYRTLHLDLTPDWELHAYEIKQWGVITDAAMPGALKVRASLINRAPFSQPYPLLKLVLEDRWGEQVRAREFVPAEYLDQGVATDRLLASDQQTNATIVIVDPGPDAEGFRFDVCLQGEAGTVCAADIPEARR